MSGFFLHFTQIITFGFLVSSSFNASRHGEEILVGVDFDYTQVYGLTDRSAIPNLD